MLIEIVNWEKYNPRNDIKHPTWFRLENNFWSDGVIFDFDNDAKMVWVTLLALASQKMRGQIDANTAFIATVLKITVEKVEATIDALHLAKKIKIPTSRRRNARVTDAGRIRTATGRTDGTDGTDTILDVEGQPAGPADVSVSGKGISEFDRKAAAWMQKAVLLANPHAVKARNANLAKWADEFRLMRECDKLDEHLIGQVLAYTFEEDPFWRTVIQSPHKFRLKWDELSMRMNNPRRVRGGAF